jgi:hypothetical protein
MDAVFRGTEKAADAHAALEPQINDLLAQAQS